MVSIAERRDQAPVNQTETRVRLNETFFTVGNYTQPVEVRNDLIMHTGYPGAPGVTPESVAIFNRLRYAVLGPDNSIEWREGDRLTPEQVLNKDFSVPEEAIGYTVVEVGEITYLTGRGSQTAPFYTSESGAVYFFTDEAEADPEEQINVPILTGGIHLSVEDLLRAATLVNVGNYYVEPRPQSAK